MIYKKEQKILLRYVMCLDTRTGKKANGWVEGIDEYWINYEIVNE
jgi:hypothetical protein